jgi:hypothetical protein
MVYLAARRQPGRRRALPRWEGGGRTILKHPPAPGSRVNSGPGKVAIRSIGRLAQPNAGLAIAARAICRSSLLATHEVLIAKRVRVEHHLSSCLFSHIVFSNRQNSVICRPHCSPLSSSLPHLASRLQNAGVPGAPCATRWQNLPGTVNRVATRNPRKTSDCADVSAGVRAPRFKTNLTGFPPACAVPPFGARRDVSPSETGPALPASLCTYRGILARRSRLDTCARRCGSVRLCGIESREWIPLIRKNESRQARENREERLL